MGMSEFFDEALEAERAKREAQAKRDRRERNARAVLAGFAANPNVIGTAPEMAREAIQWADALIAALDAEGGDE